MAGIGKPDEPSGKLSLAPKLKLATSQSIEESKMAPIQYKTNVHLELPAVSKNTSIINNSIKANTNNDLLLLSARAETNNQIGTSAMASPKDSIGGKALYVQ